MRRLRHGLVSLLLVAAAVAVTPGEADAAKYRPDTIITNAYQGEGEQYVVWFTASNINSPNYAIEFECRIDGSDWYACGLLYPGLPTYEYLNGLAPGRHVFKVRTVFRGATDGTPAKAVFRL